MTAGLALALGRAFIAACRDELQALKPGNVHVFADGHRMTVADFERSAEAAAGPLSRSGARTGLRILEAVRATQAAAGQNTNLGIVLLCAPLARAAEAGEDLRSSLKTVLADLDREDAANAFEAIRLASPAGLGAAARHDVREPAAATLREAMAEAASRDRIARAYADGFSEVFDLGLPALTAASGAGPRWWPAAAAYLAFLRVAPDSHVSRKFGDGVANALREETEAWLGGLAPVAEERALTAYLADFDRSLKERGLNPGTCADLTVATLFVARLHDVLRERQENGSLRPGEAGASLLSGQPVRRLAGC